MDIQPITYTNFKGYDARPLKGFLMSTNKDGIASAMQKIGEKEGFKIYTAFVYKKIFEGIAKDQKDCLHPWAQDYWTFFKNKLQTKQFDLTYTSIKDFFGLNDDFTEKITCDNNRKIYNAKIKENKIRYDRAVEEHDEEKMGLYYWEAQELDDKMRHTPFHIAGGNIFIVKGDKDNEVIIGKDALEIYNIDEIKGMYNVDNVTVLPQMDFHLDLFIRPLNNKNILLTDDNMTLEILKNNLQKIKDYAAKQNFEKQKEINIIIENYQKAIENFTNEISSNEKAKTNEVESILKENGYNVIKVPGRIYETNRDLLSNKQNLGHFCNYINANAFINKTGELVYITNHSNFDNELGITTELAKEIGCSFEDAFVESISPFIKKEHIYFIKGDEHFFESKMLHEFGGGIHCTCAEIPTDIDQVL